MQGGLATATASSKGSQTFTRACFPSGDGGTARTTEKCPPCCLKPKTNASPGSVPGPRWATLFRRYWIPALLSEELPEPDGAPVRVRLLGEDLVAFRDSERHGRSRRRVTVRTAARRCSSAATKSAGLRCVYHGWKFDRDGTCVDMPSEPPDSLFKTKVTIDAYPDLGRRRHRLGLHGSARAAAGAAGDTSWCARPRRTATSSKTFEDCNFLQALEGGIDPTHATIMHNMNIGDRRSCNNYDELVAALDIDVTDYGFTYAGIRSPRRTSTGSASTT